LLSPCVDMCYGLWAHHGLLLFVSSVDNPDVRNLHCWSLGGHSYSSHSVRHLWTSDRPVAETSIWLHTTFKKRQTSMSSAGFEPAIPAFQRQQNHAFDHVASGAGLWPTCVVHLLAELIAECWSQIWKSVWSKSIFFRSFLIFDIARCQHQSAQSANQNRHIICLDKCILARKCSPNACHCRSALLSGYGTLQILCSSVSGSFTVACRAMRLTCWSP
jgi:hypothetical protein